MEQLVKQVKGEMLRTFIWLVISLGVGLAIFYLVW